MDSLTIIVSYIYIFMSIILLQGIDAEVCINTIRGGTKGTYSILGDTITVYYPKRRWGVTSGVEFFAMLCQPMDQASLSYRLKFTHGFNFKLGGKLPGLFGSSTKSRKCRSSPGNTPTETEPSDCFATRFLWRKRGKAGVNLQIPDDHDICRAYQPEKSRCSKKDGHFIGVKSTKKFLPDVWHYVKQEIRLNTPGFTNGTLKVWIDGVQIANLTELVYRTNHKVLIDSLYFSTYFGGKDSKQKGAPGKTEVAYFKSIKVSEELTDSGLPEKMPTLIS